MLGFSVDALISETEANEVIKAYMVTYVQGLNHSTFQLQEFMDTQAEILTYYPAWPDTERFADEELMIGTAAGDDESARTGGAVRLKYRRSSRSIGGFLLLGRLHH